MNNQNLISFALFLLELTVTTSLRLLGTVRTGERSVPLRVNSDADVDFFPQDAGDGLAPEEIAAIKSLQNMSKFGRQKQPVMVRTDSQSRIVNINLNTHWHFEVAIAIAHWFKTGDLPHHSAVPQHIETLLNDASKGKTQVYLNSANVLRQDRQKILHTNMKDEIKVGEHDNPDLTVLVTVYSRSEFFDVAIRDDWYNNEKLLLIVHDFLSHAFTQQEIDEFGKTHEERLKHYGVSSKEFLNFRNWNNALGVSPMAHQWVLPTYFPFAKKPNRKRTPTMLCTQGAVKRRNFGSLHEALQMLPETCNDAFRIRVAGAGHVQFDIKNLTYAASMDDLAFGEFFQDCDYLLFLVDWNHDMGRSYLDKERAKLTSSVTRSLGSNVPVIALSPFKTIYPMLSGEFYEDNAQLSKAIQKVAEC